MAQFEYGKKLERMKLPRLEQEEFYRRYSIFEKKAFNNSQSSFYKTRTGHRSWAPSYSTKDTFYHTASNGMELATDRCRTNSQELQRTFKQSARKFILRSNSRNPAYPPVSQKGKTSLVYVRLVNLTVFLRTNFCCVNTG